MAETLEVCGNCGLTFCDCFSMAETKPMSFEQIITSLEFYKREIRSLRMPPEDAIEKSYQIKLIAQELEDIAHQNALAFKRVRLSFPKSLLREVGVIE